MLSLRWLLRMTAAFLGLYALLFCVAQAQSTKPTCDDAVLLHRVGELHAAQAAALTIPVTREDETDVSPEAIKQIQSFKNALSNSLQIYFRCLTDQMPEAATVQADLYKALDIPIPPPPNDQPSTPNPSDRPTNSLYLNDVTLSVKTTPDSRHLVAVLTTFGIPDGQDSDLEIFAPDDRRQWSQVVRFASRPYTSIFGGFSGLNYQISPPNRLGHWFVVSTHVNPWPSSCWQTQYVDVVRPQDFGFQYQFFHDEAYGYICVDDTPKINRITADSFEVRLRIPSVDEGQLQSPTRLVYKVTDEEAIRVQPVALNPINFVDEWLRRPWRDARDWSAANNQTSLHKMHAAAGGGDFTAIRTCSTRGAHEIQFSVNEGSDIFFTVGQRQGFYTMLSATRRHSTACRGANLLNSIQDR